MGGREGLDNNMVTAVTTITPSYPRMARAPFILVGGAWPAVVVDLLFGCDMCWLSHGPIIKGELRDRCEQIVTEG